ncbi:hypothetical protein NHX12_033844 [Muraenolepis orangiensis]|uniref:Selectin P n=1 Tax=Muraenolepis orangiensis TaxID=630683 RepID=A0A9Q0IJ65_9TELE|nr:hypothetical protein NHX12_033844 [Muraenolepis orangiensis]
MDWESARDWCQRDYTDMVAIQNQEEIAHLNSWLPKKTNYYWIGIRKVDSMWTWVGTNKTLTEKATNWAHNEPNNAKNIRTDGKNSDCVEMYIQRDSEAGKWNDERCDKKKTALCYAAACQNDSCAHGDCVETINSHLCQCFEGFYGDKCKNVVRCNPDEVVAPAKASFSCTDTHGSFAYGTLCDFSCEEGYRLSHPDPVRCTADGSWSEFPTCELVPCEDLSPPKHGGYAMLPPSRSDTLLCGASGHWNDSVPICAAVQCHALSETDSMAVRCGDDDGGDAAEDRFSYGRSCSFACSRGYRLRGAHNTTCTATATWSRPVPSCERVICPVPEGDVQASQCSGPLDRLLPGSTCSFTCRPGFELQRAPVIQCTEDGTWNATVPTCKEGYQPSDLSQKVMECTASGTWSQQPPVCEQLGQINCPLPLSSSYPQGSVCTFTCNDGHDHQGPLTTKCTQAGQWSSPPPTCTAVICPVPEGDVQASQCSGPLDRLLPGSTCSFTCRPGFELQRAPVIQCTEDGTWNATVPTCKEGYQLSDLSQKVMECTASGTWSQQPPVCEPVQCSPPVAPELGQINCPLPLSSSYPQGSVCTFTCNDGHDHQGPLTTKCTQAGQWSSPPPTCTAVICPVPEGDVQASQCSGPLDRLLPGSTCSFTCRPGFELQRAPVIQCTEDGTWNATVPTCKELGQINCPLPLSSSYPQGSVCTFTCNDGHDHQGPLTTKCTQAGQWSSPPPTCTAIRCPVLDAPVDGTLNCTHSDPSTHGSECSFACNPGYTVHGHQIATCGLHGNWTAETPLCQAVPQPLLSPTTVGLAAGGAASMSGLSLAVWLLKRLRNLKGRKFSLASNSDAEDPPQHYKNSIDSLI